MKLRVGLVGLGNYWESRYRPALRTLSDRFEVRAVCDPVNRLAQLAAEDFRAVAVDGFRALTAREDIDAIVLLSAQWFGELPIVAACDAGKAVYCAAPLDMRLSQALELKKRVEAAGIAFVAEMPLRQVPATLRLKELIATRLGQPKLLFCHRRLKAEDPPAKQQTASTLREMIYLVDWCRYVVGGEPTSVFGVVHAANDGDKDDYRMMSLDFSEAGALAGAGPVAQISCGQYIPADWHEAVTFRPPAALQVACERGIAFIDLPATLIWFDSAGRHMESLESERPVGEQSLLSFYRAATSLVRNMTSLEDAYRAQYIALQAQASREEGRRMPIEF